MDAVPPKHMVGKVQQHGSRFVRPSSPRVGEGGGVGTAPPPLNKLHVAQNMPDLSGNCPVSLCLPKYGVLLPNFISQQGPTGADCSRRIVRYSNLPRAPKKWCSHSRNSLKAQRRLCLSQVSQQPRYWQMKTCTPVLSPRFHFERLDGWRICNGVQCGGYFLTFHNTDWLVASSSYHEAYWYLHAEICPEFS